eukprot:2678-Heterococcus_DN1.PRE.1
MLAASGACCIARLPYAQYSHACVHRSLGALDDVDPAGQGRGMYDRSCQRDQTAAGHAAAVSGNSRGNCSAGSGHLASERQSDVSEPRAGYLSTGASYSESRPEPKSKYSHTPDLCCNYAAAAAAAAAALLQYDCEDFLHLSQFGEAGESGPLLTMANWGASYLSARDEDAFAGNPLLEDEPLFTDELNLTQGLLTAITTDAAADAAASADTSAAAADSMAVATDCNDSSSSATATAAAAAAVVRVGVGVIVTSRTHPECVLVGRRKGSHGAGEVMEETGLALLQSKCIYRGATNNTDVDGSGKHYVTIFMQ